MVALYKRRFDSGILGTLLVILISCGFLLGLEFSGLELKWLVYILASVIIGVAIVVSGYLTTALLVFFVLGLQAHVSLYLTEPERLSVGVSGPTALALRLVTVPAVCLVLRYAAESLRHDGWRFFWGREITLPALAVFATTAMTGLYTPERSLVVYALIDMMQLYCLFLAGLNMVRTSDDMRLVMRLLMLTLAIQAVIYFVQNAAGFTFDLLGQTTARGDEVLQRHGGTVSHNVKGYANFILPLLLLAVSRFLTLSNPRAWSWALLLCGLGSMALILTFTRASWAGFILGVGWIIVAGWQRRLLHPRRLLMLGAVALLAAMILLPKIMLRLSEDHVAAYGERAALMRMAWNVIESHPLLGVGSGAYGYVFRDYLSAEDRMAATWEKRWLYIVHNTYLVRWAETGIFGLASLLLLLGVGLWQAVVCSRSLDENLASFAVGWGAGLLALMWEMCWDLSLGPQTQCVLWFAFGLTLAAKRIGEPEAMQAWRRQAEPSVYEERL